MPTVNPGPAVTGNVNAVADYIPVNSTVSSIPGATNALRLLAVQRAIPIAAGLGDIAVIPLINVTAFVPFYALMSNALSGSPLVAASGAALTFSLNGGPGVTGTSIIATHAATNLSGGTMYLPTLVAGTLLITNYTSVTNGIAAIGTGGAGSNFLYLNSTVVSAAATQADFWLWGYDLS